jgi:hypothetical protein
MSKGTFFFSFQRRISSASERLLNRSSTSKSMTRPTVSGKVRKTLPERLSRLLCASLTVSENNAVSRMFFSRRENLRTAVGNERCDTLSRRGADAGPRNCAKATPVEENETPMDFRENMLPTPSAAYDTLVANRLRRRAGKSVNTWR